MRLLRLIIVLACGMFIFSCTNNKHHAVGQWLQEAQHMAELSACGATSLPVLVRQTVTNELYEFQCKDNSIMKISCRWALCSVD